MPILVDTLIGCRLYSLTSRRHWRHGKQDDKPNHNRKGNDIPSGSTGLRQKHDGPRDFGSTHNFIDPDAIKASHPNYDPANAAALHAWSKDEEEKQFMAAVSGEGLWVVDGTGVNAEALVRRMNIAKSFGFTVKLFYVKVTLQTSLRRAARRERVVPEDIIREKARNIATSFEICSQYADAIEVVSNDSDR